MTKQRALVKQIIVDSKAHLNAQEIYNLAKQQMPAIAMATIYNNLNALAELGEVRRIRIDKKAELFDGKTDPHDHLVCQRCGEVKDVELLDMLSYICEKYGIKATGYDLNIHYVCEKCK